MSKFVLTAQLQLQAPRNTQQVINQLRGQLQGAVNIPVNVEGGVKAAKEINQISKATREATTAGERMGKAFGASIKRFAAFNIATRAVGLFASKISQAVDESIKFERELIKISQVTGKSVAELGKLTKTITNLSTSLGVSSTSLLETSRILAQAGIQARDLDVALTALAKTTLAPTFDNITETAEGAVAILAQFKQGVGALESQLGAINAVAGQFAVESGDLISVVRRTGGVFKAAGGDLKELIALFTSVRATTRENAESIATGLRTIFTRIQRPETIGFLKELGVQLTDVNGKFVGPYEAVRRLSQAFGDLPQGDLRFVKIAEELGGFRQIGKVIPLLQQFSVAEEARQAAIEGGNSLNKDAEAAQKSLAVQLEKTRERFLALIRDISQTATFQIMIKSLLGIANAFISMADAIKPILPLLTALAAVKFTRGIGSFVSGIGAGVRGKNQGGKIHAFASGGFVPGSGNRDTVPAMLTPGEFVIRKSSVNKIGAGTLAAMNENKYAGGGTVQINPGAIGGFFLRPTQGEDRDYKIPKTKTITLNNPNLKGVKSTTLSRDEFVSSMTAEEQANAGIIGRTSGGKPKTKLSLAKGSKGLGTQAQRQVGPQMDAAYERGQQEGKNKKGTDKKFKIQGTLQGFFVGKNDVATGGIARAVSEETKSGLTDTIKKTVGRIRSDKLIDADPINSDEKRVFESSMKSLFEEGGAQSTVEGYILEGIISAISNAKLQGGTASFDYKSFTGESKKRLSQMFGGQGEIDALIKADAKRTAGSKSWNSIIDKIEQDLNKRSVGAKDGAVRFLASGGGISGSDTVPAMLTPGEFVINKKASQSIGYGNLNKMNKQGVAGFAKGGPVGVQKFNKGGDVGGGGMLSPGLMGGFGKLEIAMMALTATIGGINAAIEQFGDKSLEASSEVAFNTIAAERSAKILTGLIGIWGGLFIASKQLKSMKAQEQIASKLLADSNKEAANSVSGASEGGKKDKDPKHDFKKAFPSKAEAEAEEKRTETKKSKETVEKPKEATPVATKKPGVRERLEGKIQASFDEKTKRKTELKTAKTDLKTSQEDVVKKKGRARKLSTFAGQQARGEDPFKVEQKEASVDKGKRASAVASKRVAVAQQGLETAQAELLTSENELGDKRKLGALLESEKQAELEKLATAKREEETAEGLLRKQKLKKKIIEDHIAHLGREAKRLKGTSGGQQAVIDYNKAKERATPRLARLDKKTEATKTRIAESQEAQKAPRPNIDHLDEEIKENNSTIKQLTSSYKAANESVRQHEGRVESASRVQKGVDTQLTASQEKLTKARRRARKIDKAAINATSEYANALNKHKGIANIASRAQSVYTAQVKKTKRVFQVAATGIKALTKAERALTAARKVGRGAAGAARRGAGAIGAGIGRSRGALMGIGGAAASVGMIGQQVFGGIAEFQQREADLASRRMDVGGAADATRQASLSESKGKLFTAGGFIEAMADPEGFVKRAKGEASRKSADAAVSTNKALQADITKGITDASRSDFRDPQGNLNIEKAIRASSRGFSQSKAAISQVQDPEVKKQMMREMKADAVAQTTALVQSGASEKEIGDFIKNVGGGSAEMQKAMQQAADSALALKAAQDEVTKANYENLQITSTFNAASVALNNFIGSVDGSSSVLDQNIAVMEAAQSNIGIDGGAAIAAIEKELISTLPDGSPGAELIKSQANQAKAVADFNTNLETNLQAVELSPNNPGQSRANLSAAITGAAGGNEQLERIAQAELAKLKDEDLGKVDITKFIQDIQSGAATLSKGFSDAAKTLNNMNKQIVQLTQRRRDAELQYLAAQKQAIDTQLEAAKIIEEFGGAKVTFEDQKAANVAKFNASAEAAGVTGLTTGSVDDFARVGNEIQQALAGQIAKGATPGGFGDQLERVDNDRRKELSAAQKDLITAAKARVSQIREELNIIKKKNALEKSSLEKLVSGDIQGFIEGQAAVGAASAIRAGDMQTAQMFGADAINAAFKDAQAQGLPPQELAKFAQASMAAAGVTNQAAVETLAGTSAEEERLRQEARGLGGVIGQTADQMVEAANMNVTAQTVILEGAMLKRSDVLSNMSAKMPGSQRDPDKEAESLYRGGMVYASRGIFVPRGTDTVPAMLTPGEFVVNRAAVQRGNNMAILQAMNNGQQANGPAMARGGTVRYYSNGGEANGGSMGISMEVANKLSGSLSSFSDAVNKLENMKLSVKLDTTNVNVNFNGASFLATLTADVKEGVLAEIRNQLPNISQNMAGESTLDTSVLG
tara:strand:+ start:6862 stop:13647 length:6786 start_codon:yes stop_codon:yes gene_type:complete